MTPDERAELEELLPQLTDGADQARADARRWRRPETGASGYEPPRMTAARLAVAKALENVADARMTYRAEIKRALDGR